MEADMLRFMTLLPAICLLTLILPVCARAAGTVDNLQRVYAGISAMRAEFRQTLLHKESGSREERSGSLFFKKPLLLRWETKKPAPELLVIGRDAIWHAFPEEELVYKYSLKLAGSASLARIVTGQARIDQDFDLEEEGREEGLHTLRLYPKKADQSVVEVLLWVDPANFMIRRLRVYDFYGNENEIVFSRYDAKTGVRDAVFSYTPPKGFEVEDRTGAAAPERSLFQ
jgi:outer membrane lipoprotein carrier protein